MFNVVAGTAPSAGEVRDLVLKQHGELRSLIGKAQRATEGAPERSFQAAEQLVRIAEELQGRLGNHLLFEERFMFPALREADAWGPQRVEALTAEHARQRRELEAFIELIESQRPPGELGRALRALSSALLVDMDEEETTFVNDSVLRDDLVSVDQSSG
jgi:iron-sulfur cluster repair protein YtfE (RIC family)